MGKRNFETGVTIAKGRAAVAVDVAWHPFTLAPAPHFLSFGPEATTKGVDKKAYYDMRFGPGKWHSFVPRLETAFASAGIEGRFTMDGMTGPTMDSHRLIWWAQQRCSAAQRDALVESLFKAYFIEGKAMCDRPALAAAAERAGLAGAADFLDSSAGLAEVQAELANLAGSSINGVPHFTLRGPTGKEMAISGGQPPEEFAQALLRVL